MFIFSSLTFLADINRQINPSGGQECFVSLEKTSNYVLRLGKELETLITTEVHWTHQNSSYPAGSETITKNTYHYYYNYHYYNYNYHYYN